MSFTLHGLAVSGGIAIGRAHLMSHATLEVSHLVIAPRLVDKEIARFEQAIERVRAEFSALKGRMQNTSAEFGAFIDLHSMILADPELSETPKQLIRERRCNAEWALVQQMELLVDQFEGFEDAYLRERSYDVRQVVERVIKELVGQPGRMALRTGKGTKEENLIVVAHDLSPADVIAYKEHHFAAFVTDVGGST
ncbi:MAG TPA: phosphoenolpyruvate-utilizing N-terminal domain-containing protein, partial [Accumulibacter sp.]|nr:phosphoenolpyruvate-utilizing N-terminal domain-containing protein [Accumulibacter sp.]